MQMKKVPIKLFSSQNCDMTLYSLILKSWVIGKCLQFSDTDIVGRSAEEKNIFYIETKS